MEKKKSDKLETSKRVIRVVEWILQDKSRQDILKLCEKHFGVSWRQAERYYLKAHESFVETNMVSLERKRGYYIQRKRKLISNMPEKEKKTAAGVQAINKVLDSMAMLEGIATTKVELSGKDGGPIEQDYNITLKIK